MEFGIFGTGIVGLIAFLWFMKLISNAENEVHELARDKSRDHEDFDDLV